MVTVVFSGGTSFIPGRQEAESEIHKIEREKVP